MHILRNLSLRCCKGKIRGPHTVKPNPTVQAENCTSYNVRVQRNWGIKIVTGKPGTGWEAPLLACSIGEIVRLGTVTGT